MKKLLNKIELKPLLISVGLVIFQTVLYFLTKIFQTNPHIIGNVIDTKIPFIKYFIIPYYIWYFMIFFIPYYLYKKDKNNLIKYIISYSICCLVANIIFSIYPSTVIRPEVKITDFFTLLTWLVYFIDNPPFNCFPSMHCAVSMLFILSICTSKKTNVKFKTTITIISILIMVSTLYTKQHVFIDFISGDIIMSLIYLLFSNNKKLTNYVKKLLRI